MPNQSRIKRKKVNLLKRVIGRRNMDGLVWFVGIQKNGITFFVNDYDDDKRTVMWSGNKRDCISFRTEKAVHRFIHKHLNDRADIFLVQAPLK